MAWDDSGRRLGERRKTERAGSVWERDTSILLKNCPIIDWQYGYWQFPVQCLRQGIPGADRRLPSVASCLAEVLAAELAVDWSVRVRLSTIDTRIRPTASTAKRGSGTERGVD